MVQVPAMLRSLVLTALGRRFLAVLVAVLTACSVAYLAVFAFAYHEKLHAMAEAESLAATRLMALALKPALVRNDGAARDVLLKDLAAAGGADFLAVTDLQQVKAASGVDVEVAAVFPLAGEPGPRIVPRATGGRIVLQPRANGPECATCHGDSAAKPVLGYVAAGFGGGALRRDTALGALLMTLAGGTVLLLALAAISRLLDLKVLRPVAQINAAASRFAQGDSVARANLSGTDEIALLGSQFDVMAGSVGAAMDKLRAGENFLQQVIDAVPDGIRVITSDYMVHKVNDAYCRQLGIPKDQAIGRTCHQSSHHLQQPCSPGLVTCPLVALPPGADKPIKCLHRHLRQDGSELFVEVSAARAELLVGDTLQSCVIESIRDLAAQAEASTQHRMAEVGQLATGIAHEIHNPLSSIHLALSAIKEDLREGKPVQAVDSYLNTVDLEINRCLTVTGRLLNLGQVSEGEPTIVDVAAAIRSIAQLVAFEAEQAGIVLSLDLSQALRTMANESDISIVVLNLVQNAIHAMPAGGKLAITARRKGGRISIAFADTGVGIAPENIERIFWPFWSKRADGNIGTGLGLSIVKATLARHGGSISVASRQGGGTTFTVLLPDADSDTTAGTSSP
ncbi:MAG: ATP-binding protein [Hyphomicrobiales bacterium]